MIPDFILTSKNVNNIFDIFPRKQIGAIPKEKRTNFLNIIFKRIINFEWLSQCIKEKKIMDIDNYIINIEELSIKKKTKNINDLQNNTINDIEELKKGLNISTKSILINNQTDNNNIINNNILNNSQNSNKDLSSSSSSFISNTFEFENDLMNMNDLSDEELFNQIKKHMINKKENKIENCEEEKKPEITNFSSDKNISSRIYYSYNSNIDVLDTSSTYNYSESQETKSNSSFFNNVSKNGKISAPKPFMKNKNIRRINSNYFAFNLGKSKVNINKNKHLTDEFEKILEFHNNEGNKFEALAYRKVISILKKYKDEINDPNKIPKIKGIGPKISAKIKEILITGKCRKSDNVSNDSKNKSIKELITVHGIGIKQANEFYAQGIKSINDLKNIYNDLPSTIQKGLKYYDDIQIKIPREEITELFKIIEEELYKILDKKLLKAEVVGSYRRGRKLCGDMDVIITRIDDGSISGILHTLLEKLTEKNIIIDRLTMSDNNDLECQIFMGICKLNKDSLYRRLDIKVYEKSLYPFALLYFTGSSYFNRSLRLFAKKKGYHLSDKELSNRFTGDKILCSSEEDIFKALDLKYQTPEERDI